MNAPFRGLVVVIPTRNRASFAIRAIQSVLSQGHDNVQVLIADNSTTASENDEVAAFCESLADRRLHYRCPPQPLPMCDNWEWALEQALQLPCATHYLYLTDRTIFKPDALNALLYACARKPNEVVSYIQDGIDDTSTPVRLNQANWTGSLYRLQASQALTATAALNARFYDCLPRMLNCVVPRFVFECIRERHGSVFLSVAPDLCFTYRFLEQFDSFLFLDRALLLQYGLYRSNGHSQSKGKLTKDHTDFVANLKDSVINNAAPVPGLNTNMNTVIHEYCSVQQMAPAERFPQIDLRNYGEYLLAEVTAVEDPALKLQMEGQIQDFLLRVPKRPPRRDRNWWGEPPLVTQHANFEAAMAYSASTPRPSSWQRSTEESFLEPTLVLGGQSSLLIYIRRALLPVMKPYSNARRWCDVMLQRHVLWRFRSS